MSDDELMPHEFASIVAGHLTGDAPEALVEEAVTDPDTGSAEAWEDEHGNLHGADGRFIPRDTETSEEEDDSDDEELESDEGEDEEEDDDEPALDADPAVQKFLEKYGNDPAAALKAAAHQASLVGRQGSELGELRQMVHELTQLVQQQPQISPLAYANFPQLLEENPGQAAQLAYQAGDDQALQAAIEVWKEDEPFEAATFWNQVQNERLFGALVVALQPDAGQQQTQAEQGTENDLGSAVAAVMRRHPDLEQHLPVIGELAQEKPYLGAALENGTPEERASALEDLYVLARGRTSDTLSRAEQSASRENGRKAKKEKAGAAVVSATRGSAASTETPMTGVERFRSGFRAHLGLPLEDE